MSGRPKAPKPPSTEPPTVIGPDLEELAKVIASQAIGDADDNGNSVQFTDKVTAFKALSNYYAMRQRVTPPFAGEAGAAFGTYQEDDEDGETEDGGGASADDGGDAADAGGRPSRRTAASPPDPSPAAVPGQPAKANGRIGRH